MARALRDNLRRRKAPGPGPAADAPSDAGPGAEAGVREGDGAEGGEALYPSGRDGSGGG